jgi:hypothetical protein
MTNPNGVPTPGQIRCSYEDGIGLGSTRLSGSVYGEGGQGFAGVPLEGVVISVHRAKSGRGLGDVVGRAMSDPQGHYSMSAMLPGGEYIVVARDSEGEELARAPLRTEDRDDSRRKVDLLVPLDPEIREATQTTGAEPEVEPSRPRVPAEDEAAPLDLAPRAVPPDPMKPAATPAAAEEVKSSDD